VLVTPSIVVSDYQDLIIIVVSVAFLCIVLLILLVMRRRCCPGGDRNSGSNAIPLTSSHLKDNKDNRLPTGRDNREQQQLLRNRDSKISNLEARPMSATEDIFISSGADELESKPTYIINNLMKDTVPMKDKATTACTGPGWHSNLDDYSKVQNCKWFTNKRRNFVKCK
jgi:hypothetical protein